MLSDNEFRILEQRLKLSPDAVKIIAGIRQTEPSKRVVSGPATVCVRYPSRKMGKTIQAESHKVALTAIYEMEYDPSVLEFYDQPQAVKLSYLSPSGRSTGTVYTPDFFVIRNDSAGWEEWRHEQDLIRLAKSQPNRYKLDADGKWHCPPGEAYAQQFGLSYTVHSSSEISWALQRNLIILDDYFDQAVEAVKPEIRAIVTRFFATSPYAPLSDILNFDPSLTADHIFSLIAAQVIVCDLRLCIPAMVNSNSGGS